MMLSPHSQPRLVEPRQARYVSGVLGMLIAMVGRGSPLGVILQQARSEVSSLLRSEAELDEPTAHAA